MLDLPEDGTLKVFFFKYGDFNIPVVQSATGQMYVIGMDASQSKVFLTDGQLVTVANTTPSQPVTMTKQELTALVGMASFVTLCLTSARTRIHI